QQPPISVVVIGINVSATIGPCLKAIQDCGYPQKLLEVIYVDGGSKDNSVEIARQFPSVRIIGLAQKRPTPGRGRNAGWRSASHDLVYFVDGDTLMSKKWLALAPKFLVGDVVAVVGRGREVEPRKDWYHLISDIEWDVPPGDCRAFGG